MPRYDALPASLPPRGLAREAAAQYVGISPTKFDTMIGDGRMPRPVRIDGRAVWDIRALDAAFDVLHRPGSPVVPAQVITRVIDEYTDHLLGNKNNNHLDIESKRIRNLSSKIATEETQMRSHHKYTHPFIDRHGVGRNYFRRPGFPSAVLPYDEDSLEFLDAYRACLAGEPLPKTQKAPIGISRRRCVEAVVQRYFDWKGFSKLASATQVNRRFHLTKFSYEHAEKDFASLRRADYNRILAETESPWMQRGLLKAIRALIKFCIEIDEDQLLESDPTYGIKIKLPKSTGFYSWKEHDLAVYEAEYPRGTRERRALALLLYTLQRRADIIRLGSKNIKDGKLHVRQQKTGTVLVLPAHPELQAELADNPPDQQTFLTRANGRPHSDQSFSLWFRKVCHAVEDIDPRASAHGLRKAGCRRLAESGCTASEIAAFSGHLTLQEVQRYIDDANKETMAEAAQEKVIKKFSKAA